MVFQKRVRVSFHFTAKIGFYVRFSDFMDGHLQSWVKTAC